VKKKGGRVRNEIEKGGRYLTNKHTNTHPHKLTEKGPS
jgi:hypothetical protein